jgi:hypothetical protein
LAGIVESDRDHLLNVQTLFGLDSPRGWHELLLVSRVQLHGIELFARGRWSPSVAHAGRSGFLSISEGDREHTLHDLAQVG